MIQHNQGNVNKKLPVRLEGKNRTGEKTMHTKVSRFFCESCENGIKGEFKIPLQMWEQIYQ